MSFRRVALIVAGIVVAGIVPGWPSSELPLCSPLFRNKPAYDRSDPDYQHYSEAFERLRVQFGGGRRQGTMLSTFCD